MLPDQLWRATLGELELSLSKVNFTTWFKHTFITEINEGKVIVAVPSAFIKSWLETKYHKAIVKALQHITDNAVKEVQYRIETVEHHKPQKEVEISLPKFDPFAPNWSAPKESHTIFRLNSRYTFDSFVVGRGNELAHAASLAVVEHPGSKYNPLFLYGGVGLGKTHLMHAIGREIQQRQPHWVVCYVSFEKFTNDFVQAVKENRMKEFKAMYRGVDILLVDDIQFMAGREQTQEEFFYTFDVLHQAGKQIVVTSDRPPRAISSLQDRLISRFEWGMIADINAPDVETRMAIIRAKSQERECALDEYVVVHMAHVIQSNVRELEGAVNKLIAYQELTKIPITLEMAKQMLATLTINPTKGALTSRQVIQAVAQFYEVELAELLGTSRKRELVNPRQIAMYLLRAELDASFPSIGADIGGRDHTTAMHACQKISEAVTKDDRLKQEIATIKQRLYQS